MKAKILKKIALSDGSILNPGDIANVSGWRNAKSLASNRYIAFLEEKAVKAPATTEETPVEKKPRAKKATAKAE